MVSLTIPKHLVTIMKVIVTVATIKFLQDRFGRAQKPPVLDSGRTHALKNNKDRAKSYEEKVTKEPLRTGNKAVRETILKELTRVQACTDLECSEIRFPDDTTKLILYQILVKDYLVSRNLPDVSDKSAGLDSFNTTSTPQSIFEFLLKVTDSEKDSNPAVQQFLRLRPLVVAPSGAPAMDAQTRNKYVDIIAKMLQLHLNLPKPNPNLTEGDVADETGRQLQGLLATIKVCHRDCPSSAEIKAVTDQHPIFTIKKELMKLLAPPQPGWERAAAFLLSNDYEAAAAAALLTAVKRVDCMNRRAKENLTQLVKDAILHPDFGKLYKGQLNQIFKTLEGLEATP
jgi:hypothetical protein